MNLKSNTNIGDYEILTYNAIDYNIYKWLMLI